MKESTEIIKVITDKVYSSFNGLRERGLFLPLGALTLLVGLSLSYGVLFSSPKHDSDEVYVTIENGASLGEIARSLTEKTVVRNPFIFKWYVRLVFGDTGVRSGDYYFNKEESAFSVARRIANGEYGLEPEKILIPEGSTVVEIAQILGKRLDLFDEEMFVKIALPSEGYLFPDTYYFMPNVRPEEVASRMRENFNTKVRDVELQTLNSGRDFKDVIIMASILEKEAHTTDARKKIAGVLWKRIEIDMPLQVDATFLYINGKNTYDLTLEDLALDSPYNTYEYKGLPIGPIANPSMNSILAALYPEESDYLFYLSDRSGNLYYSVDFEQHKRYKEKYVN